MPPRRRRNRLPRYLGLNLAWAPRNSSGGAVIEANPDGSVRLVSTTSLRSHEDILAWIARNRGRSGAVLAVNAPLIVENTSGPRPCDNLLVDHFAQYQIDDYQANIVNASHPRTIGRALMRMGFDPDPGAPGDRVFETYNRPTQILLWNLDRPIRLKTGPVGARKDAVSRFREMMADKLSDASPALDMSPAFQRLLRADLPSSNGSRVGELEDRLEAALAAYSAAYLALRGLDDCALLGDLESGYILLPTARYPTEDPNPVDDELDDDGTIYEEVYLEEGEDGEMVEVVEEIVYEDGEAPEDGEYIEEIVEEIVYEDEDEDGEYEYEEVIEEVEEVEE